MLGSYNEPILTLSPYIDGITYWNSTSYLLPYMSIVGWNL